MNKNHYLHKLSTEQKFLLSSWLSSGWLMPQGKEFITEIVERGWYNKGDEAEKLNKMRNAWVKMYKDTT